MPDVPASCQPIADQLGALQTRAQALAAQAEQESGAAAWHTLAQLADVHAQAAATQKELDACVTASNAPLAGTLTLIDVRPDPPAETRTVLLWDVDHPTAAPVTAALQGSAFGFTDPLPANKAVSVQAVLGGAAVGAGFDFRTGPLQANRRSLPVELLLLPDMSVDEATISAWAGTVQVAAQQVTTGDGTVLAPVTVGPTGFVVSLAGGAFVVIVHTTVAASHGGLVPLPTTPTPVAATFPVTVLPDMNPLGDPAAPVKVSVGNPIEVQDGGVFGGLAAPLAPLVFGLVRGQVEQQVAGWLNAQLPGLVAAAFALDALPAGCVITVRSAAVTDAVVTLSAVVGDLGDALGTFTPQKIVG